MTAYTFQLSFYLLVCAHENNKSSSTENENNKTQCSCWQLFSDCSIDCLLFYCGTDWIFSLLGRVISKRAQPCKAMSRAVFMTH